MWAVLGRVALQAAAQFLQTKAGRATVAGVLVAVLVTPLVLVTVVYQTVLGNVQAGQRTSLAEAELEQQCFTVDDANVVQDPTRWASLSPEQQGHATTILGVVKAAVVTPGGAVTDADREHAAVIAVATAMQESGLRNLTGGDRDSLGLFQQRPSMAWGTEEQILDPVYAATAFLYGAGTNPGLVDVPGWDSMSLTAAAQAVQRSGFPTAYAKWQALAESVVDEAWTAATAIPVSPTLDRPDLSTTTAVLRPVSVQIRGADGECELLNPDGPGIPGWDGKTWRKPQPWGGYQNGRIPIQALCAVPWQPAELGQCDAVEALTRLNVAFRAQFGVNLTVTDGYRDYAAQVAMRAKKGSLAATPGTSNHGWGLAWDLGGFGGVGQFDRPYYLWMKANSAQFGYMHPPYMDEGGSGPLEPWHWEYMGQPTEQ